MIDKSLQTIVVTELTIFNHTVIKWLYTFIHWPYNYWLCTYCGCQ